MPCESKTLKAGKINRILAMMRARKYVVFSRPYELNIIGIRNAKTDPNKFDDVINVIWKDDKGKWNGKEYKATTDPSTIYLERGGYKDSKTGTAILPQGQYLNKWTIRGHGTTKYEALGQGLTKETEICVYRDYDRNSTLNFDIDSKSCGNYGINIHRAKKGGADDGKGNTETIGVYSAGCQVFQNYYCFQEFMEMARKQRDLYGNKFSYTLFDLSLKRKFLIKRYVYTIAIVGSLTLIGYGVYLSNQKK
jgi:hypothetical protein